MKKVFIYKRVSDEDQVKGYSLTDQDARLVQFCQTKGFTIIGAYEEDGISAKTFNRPSYIRMREDAKKNKPDLILFITWKRFSRNLEEGLTEIRRWREKGIEVQAIDQPIDFGQSMSKFMLAFYLADAEVDNDQRSEATTRGMRRAMKEGRYVSAAPHGYLNSRDEKNKPLLVSDPQKSPLIAKAFDMMATGSFSQNEVRKEIWKCGLKLSRSRFFELIKNPLYCGQLRIPAYKDEPAEIVKGIHEPLISESVFYKVQDVLSGKKRRYEKKYTKVHEDLPLRGFLYCNDFDHKMTGSCSHGRNEKYHYYHCDNKIKCERNRAQQVNDSFVELLKSIQVKKEFIEDLQFVLGHTLKPDTSGIGILKSKIEAQSQRLQILQDRFIDGHITSEDYQQIRARYEATLFDLNNQKNAIENFSKEFSTNFSQSLTFLENLAGYYQQAGIENKRKIIGSTIAGKVYFYKNKCRTESLNPAIMLISNSIKGFSAKDVLKTGTIRHLVPYGDPAGTESRTILLYEGVKKLSDCLKLVA